MVRLTVMIGAEGSDILLRICTAFAKRDHVMRLEKHASVRCSETGRLAVLTESLCAIKSPSAKPCIANECHSRNCSALYGGFNLRQ
jgi:hypothetical protein